MTESSLALAIDVGGTKLAAALVEPAGRVATSEQVPTPAGVDAEQLWRTLDSLLDRVLDDPVGGAAAAGGRVGRLAGVGCGCGGPMRWPSGVVSPLNIAAWRDFPLRSRLAERFPGVAVRVHNDAICVAVGEHWRGAGRGCRNVLGMVVSTGVGGGLVLDDRLVSGTSGNAGHIGHVVVEPDGPKCRCGGRGCLEAVARGPALVAWAQDRGWRADQPTVTGKDVVADAALGHPVCRAALERAGCALGIAIASATSLCDVEVVAVGGGLSQAGPLLFAPLERTLRAHARIEFARQVRVVPTGLGQNAGLVGAAALIFLGERYWPAD